MVSAVQVQERKTIRVSQILSCSIFTKVYLQCTDVGTLSKNLLCFLQSPGLPEALSYDGFIWLPLGSCCHSFWTLLYCLYILTALFVVLQAYYPAFSLTSAASVPSRLILLSCVYVYCRWLVCHRHVVTACLQSPQRVLWSAACNQLSIWYIYLIPIFVSFLISFADLFISNSSFAYSLCFGQKC